MRQSTSITGCVRRLVGRSVCNAFVRRSTRRTLLVYLALFFVYTRCIKFSGHLATTQIIEEGRQLAADVVTDAQTKQRIAILCEELDDITQKLANLIANGQVGLIHSVRA